MAYSLIPPILVILSIIGIILFLMKKAPEIARIEDATSSGSDKRRFWKAGFKRDRPNIDQSPNGGKINQHSLMFLEKMTRKLKVFFLKLENLFTSWNESIRVKRKRGNAVDNKGTDKEHSRTLDIIRDYDFEKKDEEKKRPVLKMDLDDEKVVRPILSEKIVKPNYSETKSRLEKILIDRIASNPKDMEAYERLGEYYFEIGELKDAKECFRQVIKLDPTNSDVKYKMKKLERFLRF